MAFGVTYEQLSKTLWSGGLDWESDTIMVALLDSGYTPDYFTDEFWNAVSTNEISGTGYTAGGQAITGAIINDADDGQVVLDCDNPAWTSATLSGIRYAVFYKDTGTPSTSPLICYVDFEADLSVTATTFTILIPASGVVTSYTYS